MFLSQLRLLFTWVPIKPHLVEERRRIGESLRNHGLCALNTWSRKRYTYQHPSGRSQIDYIFICKALTDGAARKASPVTVPMASWRSSGHQPVKASILWDWRPWKFAVKQTRRPNHEPLVAVSEQHQRLAMLKVKIEQGPTGSSGYTQASEGINCWSCSDLLGCSSQVSETFGLSH